MPAGIISPPLTMEAFVDAYNLNIRDFSRNVWDRRPAEYPDIAMVETTDRWIDQFMQVQGVPPPILNRDLEPLPQIAPVKGNATAIRQSTYRSQITVEETMLRTAQFKQVFDNAADAIESVKTLKDFVVANVFNNGTTGSQTYGIVEYDGVNRALFSTVHAYENGSGTFSNYLNVAVPPNVDTVWQVAMQYLGTLKDLAGNYLGVPMDITILTPASNPAFGVAAEEIVKSQDRPDTADRATNILRNGAMNVKHRVLVNLTSTTRWYIILSPSTRAYPLRIRELESYSITPLEKIGPANPHALVQTLRTQFGVGFVGSYRGIVAVGT